MSAQDHSLADAWWEHAEHEHSGAYDEAVGPRAPRQRPACDTWAPDFTEAVCVRLGAQQVAAGIARIPRPFTNDRSTP
jgi:hypothetical protein